MRSRGRVKVYFPLKEYGFITRDHGKDVFFLRSGFVEENVIGVGAEVEFEIVADGKGLRAVQINRIS